MTLKSTLMIFSLALSLLCAGWTGWWFYAAGAAKSFLTGWLSQQQTDGWHMEYTNMETRGFPGTVDISLQSVDIQDPTRRWQIGTNALKVSFKPWQFDRYNMSSESPLKIETPHFDDPVHIHEWTGSYHHNDPVQRHDIQLGLNRITGPGDLFIEEAGVSFQKPFAKAQTSKDLIGVVKVELVHILLPDLMPSELQDPIGASILEIDIYGPAPLPATDAAAYLNRWQDAGGRIDVREFSLIWQELHLKADGTVALDQAMRPQAALGAQVYGLSHTARQLEKAGLITRTMRGYIELGAGLFSGNQGQVRVPVSIQDGVLYIGPVSLLKVPPLIQDDDPPSPVQESDQTPARGQGNFLLTPPPTVSEETLNAH